MKQLITVQIQCFHRSNDCRDTLRRQTGQSNPFKNLCGRPLLNTEPTESPQLLRALAQLWLRLQLWLQLQLWLWLCPCICICICICLYLYLYLYLAFCLLG